MAKTVLSFPVESYSSCPFYVDESKRCTVLSLHKEPDACVKMESEMCALRMYNEVQAWDARSVLEAVERIRNRGKEDAQET